MGFWETVLSTTIGGVVAAFAAWLFSLNLAKRDQQGRERIRAEQYTEAMRTSWIALAAAYRDHLAALRAAADGSTALLFSTRRGLVAQLVSTAAAARGRDRDLVDILGTHSLVHLDEDPPRTGILEEANRQLLDLAVWDPDDLDRRRADAIAAIRKAINEF